MNAETTVAHTPAPWEVTDNFGEGKRLHMVWAHGQLLARTCYEPSSEANVLLIAAAPDLLAACKRALDVSRGDVLCLPDEEDGTCYRRNVRESNTQLAAAIAKAEGRS